MKHINTISYGILVGAACSSSFKILTPEKPEPIQTTNGSILPTGMYNHGFRLVKSSLAAPCKDLLLTPSYPLSVDGEVIPLQLGADVEEIPGNGCFSSFIYNPNTQSGEFSSTEQVSGSFSVNAARKEIHITLQDNLTTILDRNQPYEHDQAVLNFILHDNPQNPYSGRIKFEDDTLTYENHGVQGSEKITIPSNLELRIMRLKNTGDFFTLRRVDGKPIYETAGTVQVGDHDILVESGYTAVIDPSALFEPKKNVPYFTLGNSYTDKAKGQYWKFQQIIDDIQNISEGKKHPDTISKCSDSCE